MFKIQECKDNKKSLARYIFTLEPDTYLVTLDSACKTYPKTAKYPYKGKVLLIKNKKFIPVIPSNEKVRKLYSTIMAEANQHYLRQLAIQASIEEDDLFQEKLLEQSLDDLDD